MTYIETEVIGNLSLTQQVITNVNLAYEMLGYIGIVSLVKPVFNGRLGFELNLYGSSDCNEKLISIESTNPTIWHYCKAFLTNNESSKWIEFSDATISDQGLGPEYDSCPIMFNLGQYIVDNNLLQDSINQPKFKCDQKYFLTYCWKSISSPIEVKSDIYSMIWPAIPENSISQINTTREQISYISSKPFEAHSGSGALISNKSKCSYIMELITDEIGFILDEYAEHNLYTIKFQMGSSSKNIELWQQQIDGSISLIDVDAIINGNYTFKSNTIYLVQIQFGCLNILAETPVNDKNKLI